MFSSPPDPFYTRLLEMHFQRKHGEFIAVLGVCRRPDRVDDEGYRCYLSEAEMQEASAFQLGSRQQAFLQGRYISKKALGIFLNDPNPLKHSIRTGIFGQPLIDTPQPRKPGLSITHSDTLAACLVYDEAHPLALDLEKLVPEKGLSIQSQLSGKELQLCRKLGETSSLAYLRLWSMKEALSKVLKTGLSADFKVFELESLDQTGAFVTGYFRNFMQYKALSWLHGDYAWSLVLPAQSELLASHFLLSLLHMRVEERSKRA